MSMECFISKFSDKGGRENNEDYVAIAENIFVLADGLGGHSNGETASRVAVEFIINNAHDLRDIGNDSMQEMITAVNTEVYNKRIGNMATTVVAAFVKNDYFNYLNVGDSRLYYFRNNKLYLQSKDHSVTQACVDIGEITAKEIRFHPDRNKLTKVLGLKNEIICNRKFIPFKMKKNDAFCLCSDGFWEYVFEEDMELLLKESRTPQEWLNSMLEKVMQRVEDNNDNLSAICVYVK